MKLFQRNRLTRWGVFVAELRKLVDDRFIDDLELVVLGSHGFSILQPTTRTERQNTLWVA